LGYQYVLISNNDISLEDDLLLSKMIIRYEQLEMPAFVSPVMIVNQLVSKEHSAWKLPDKTKEILNSSFILKFLGYWYLKHFLYKIKLGAPNEIKVDCLPGSFFMGKTAIFKKINYFDENTFLYYEETIIGYKVKELNLNNYIIQELNYNHFTSKSIDRLLNNIKKHKILLESRCYYWTHYRKVNKIFPAVLKLLFKIWTVEFKVITSFSNIYKRLQSFKF
jgi:GT2 family glycosyltransferase